MWIIFWLKNLVDIIVIVNFATSKQNNNYNNPLKPRNNEQRKKINPPQSDEPRMAVCEAQRPLPL